MWILIYVLYCRSVIVCNCVIIMYKLHECNQLPLQLLQQINSQFQFIAITEKSVINYSQLQLPTTITTTLLYTILHYTTLQYTTLHYTTLHYTTLHYTILHYTTLYYRQIDYYQCTYRWWPWKSTRSHFS